MPDSVAPSPGFYEDAGGRRRWWDGNAWTEHFQPQAETGSEPVGPVLQESERRAVLERAMTKYVQEGYKLESLSGRQAVVSRRQRVRVGLNLVLTLVTAGVWLIVLGLRLLSWPVDRVVLTVDEHGTLDGEFIS